MKNLTRIPLEIDQMVTDFCREISPDSIPVYVRYVETEWSKAYDCFINSKRFAGSRGGSPVIGWRIFEIPGKMIEAEFHSLVQLNSGEYIDITPNGLDSSKVLFLPDPVRVYNNMQVDNIRKPLDRDPLIKELIELSKMIFEEQNKGNLAYRHGAIPLSEVLRNLMLEKAYILQEVMEQEQK